MGQSGVDRTLLYIPVDYVDRTLLYIPVDYASVVLVCGSPLSSRCGRQRRDRPTVHKRPEGRNQDQRRKRGGSQHRDTRPGRVRPLEMDGAPRRRVAPAAARVAPPPLILLLATTLFLGRAAAYGSHAQHGAGGMTDLQKHAAFFDANGDGVVSISETYDAFRALGFGIGMSSVSAAFINGALASKTRPENATSSHLDIYIENIHKGIHGSDSGAYDAEGRFVPEKFDEIFARHAKTVPNALTSDDIDELLQADREPSDYQGWVGATSEWKILYSLAKDKDGLLRKDVARGVYDGSLFHQLVQERRGSGDK